MRRRFRWDPEKNRMVPIASRGASSGVLISGDLPDFVSPIDGTVIHGRRGLREHMKRHNVTHTQDFKEEWAKKAKEREAFFKGQTDRESRIEALKNAFEKSR